MAYFSYKQNLLNHFKYVQTALERFGAEASVNARDFVLEVRAAGKRYSLCPQFLELRDGARQYTPRFQPDVHAFAGWYPYFNRRWELSDEKLKFKAYAAANGLATPEHSTDPSADMADVVVKKNVSSFSEGVDGPFRHARIRPLEPGEYYERFVRGRSAKIYYVEDRPVCLELESPATVIGDGRRTIRQLLATRCRIKQQPIELKKQARYVRFLGRSLDDVLEAGAGQEVDFRYGSIFNLTADMETVDLAKNMIQDLAAQLAAIGERLWTGIPAELRRTAVYTVDAVLDADGKLWLVEMNSNPYLHPWLYPAMFDALFRAEAAPQPTLPYRPAGNGAQSANETFQLALMQFAAGATAQALALWHRVLQMQPDHAGALYHIGLACARDGRAAESRRALETLLYTVPRSNVYFDSARQLLNSLGGADRIDAPVAPGGDAPTQPQPSRH
ncbi:MAG TPA: hypothetical protein VFB01_04885 [Burkholderiales bacterium]|nr:hypothetical protein [Burkholderiales bacterium]